MEQNPSLGKPSWFSYFVLVVAALIAIFPVFWIFSTSLKPAAEVLSPQVTVFPKTVTLENYQQVLQGGLFWQWMFNSVMIALLTTVIGIILAATTAYSVSRFEFWGKKTVLFAFLVAQMFPGAILIVPLYNIMKDLGLLNTFSGLIIAYSTLSLPFCVWMLKGFFDAIPMSLEEAAMIDGMTAFGTFVRIILPLSLPGLAVTGFFSFITAWNEFMFALTFMTGENHYTLPVGLRTYVFEFNTAWHLMAAGAIIVTIPVLVVFLVAQRFLISGLTAGGVKG
ncbi:ABC transporter permease [bacterium (Candidatus Blackallbacteria) CG17_big_fil_post_rev_8_21_14_2_50_48_46]|uniref:ABC transporter permease n=1 Tax=bacterium (Candidatus Blackallbacteria) CG17_big_fil_post_rev_8_21_14_2_50_48_46 TaxID=2014261 RepID=A0A2M7G7U4_9BACT|nr:MAG: ABC transporter permease [bacterium (Candidatus Blackallbacteria) CG18_big_fil_WC_8_21_14_2_50_49_26]PIW18144.1 MAG: ABC transporter permease [bacterium (Candidatus Blackallbacteria) CG17_big_fil_post_rev_8_21_14_2_50_48_46]PIW47021.1 MAG: ABC transporter permease [bacterium (Candidatus Blackallbacteria) CG13_big_fil_rev_8_21_14_2_50_49_14]